MRRKRKQVAEEDQEEQEMEIRSRPIVTEDNHGAQGVEQQVQNPGSEVGADTPQVDKRTPNRYPDSTLRDPKYTPSRSPHTMRELAATHQTPPLIRSRARLHNYRNLMPIFK